MATRYKTTIEYDGTEFNGWQSQPNGRTVQDVVEQALGRLLQERARLHAAGRTDAGVHALGQVAHFDTSAERTHAEILRGTNTYLPPEVVLREVEQAAATFDARRDARLRKYRFQLLNSSVRPALERHRVVHISHPLNVELMRQACAHLVGRHDFSAFRSVDCAARRTQLTLERADVRREGELLVFDFGCRSFLMNMIRIMVGALVEIGRGKVAPEIVDEIFASGDRRLAGPTLPPHGLTLMAVHYPPAGAVY